MNTNLTGKALLIFLLYYNPGSYASSLNAPAQKPLNENSNNKKQMVEIRSYNLKPGKRDLFHKLMIEQSLPMLLRWKVQVVAYGPSLHDDDSYFLVRAYDDLEDRQQSQDAFYGSEEWKSGPREAILALIVNYTTIAIPADSIPANLISSAMENKTPMIGDKEQLSALNALFIENFMTNDTVSHNKIIHKDFVYISSSGKIVKRDDYMKAWAHGWDDKVDKSFEYKDESIRIFGNMALVRSNTFYSRLENGKLVHGKTVYTDTYVKEDGRWWCVQAQITQVKP